jgi:hypothetical protein
LRIFQGVGRKLQAGDLVVDITWWETMQFKECLVKIGVAGRAESGSLALLGSKRKEACKLENR